VGEPPQPGGGEPVGSKVPVHWSQLEADWWHHPVPSSPQSPQSAPNRQQPLPPGEGLGEGEGFPPGVGAAPAVVLKSKQAMKVSGAWPGAQTCLASFQGNSESGKVSVDLPMLLASLQVLPTFQTQRPIPSPPGHENEEGTW